MDPSTLRDRLRGIVKSPAGGTAAGLERPSGLHETAADVLGGAWRQHPAGGSFVVTRRLPREAVHGAHRVGDFADGISGAWSAATLMGANLARPPYLFFDLETTGLSGGAGTYAFLVGCGWFDDEGGFVTEQHLMIDYAGERSMLQIVAEQIARVGSLVTFNGKSFDAPLLETRYLYHRLAPPWGALPHVDLLHPARRFWGSAAGCSLGVLEQDVLGAERTGDVPGFEIPARYFHFVRTGDARPLEGVFQHNRLDLLSLAGLTARVFHLVDAGPGASDDAQEVLALGRVYGRAGLDERAEEAFARAVTLSRDHAVTLEAHRALALAARRQRRYEAAATHWRQVLDVPECPPQVAREALEALAIHHEHRVRDLAVAKMCALRGLELEVETAGDATRHRLARLERKIVSEQRASLFPSSPSQPSYGSPTSARRTSS